MKIIIWGHKQKTLRHTHSYIHEGFYNAFKHMGYDTYWMDNEDDVSMVDFANSIFLTEGQVDAKIPIRDDCKYVLHYCDPEKYKPIIKNCLYLERAMICERERLKETKNAEILEPYVYFQKDYCGTIGWKIFSAPIGAPAIYMLWATDLLPDEIKLETAEYERSNDVYWVGTLGLGMYGNGEQVGPYALAASRAKHNFISRTDISKSAQISSMQLSYTSPVIVGKWQLENGYIPCRLFKNISYGQLPCTNSKHVAAVFGDKIRCNENTMDLFFEAQQEVHLNTEKLTLLKELMSEVKDKHTYINRVNTLMDYLNTL